MQARWSVAQILDMAPNAGSRSAARRTANPAPWSELGTTDTLIWGSCQGSGRSPYQVVVELDGPVFRCSCPSRLYPCKHGLGLLLQWSAGRGTLGQVAAPRGAHGGPGAPVWASGRSGGPSSGVRGSAGEFSGPDKSDDPADAVEVARRAEGRLASAAQREALMTSGVAEFRQWLGDLARAGLGSARHQPYRFWDAAAARLVDAKLPGLAERVRNAGSLVAGGGDWAGPLLAETGRWYAAIRAWERRPGLDDAVAADLATFMGITQRRESVVARGTARGHWRVVGVRQGGDTRLRNQRTWLIPTVAGARDGAAAKTWPATEGGPAAEGGLAAGAGPVAGGGDPRTWVLLLDFAAAGAAMTTPAVVGSLLDAELAVYPGNPPARATFATPPIVVGRAGDMDGAAASVRHNLATSAAMVAANPWRDRMPLALRSVRVVLSAKEGQWVVDEAGDGLRLDEQSPLWTLLAITGGRPADVFGELETDRFYPMTVSLDGEMVDLG